MLAGHDGDGRALAMRLVVRAGEVLGAQRLIPITRAHLDACLYHGQASLDFVHAIGADGARVAVPTTLNVGALDLIHPELWRGDAESATNGRLLMDTYRDMGAIPSYTCAPYQVTGARPSFGEQVAWAESNAIVFCNSVLGARTNRYGDFIDVACAVSGRVPVAGLHVTRERRARMVLRLARDVPRALFDDDSFYPVLGLVLGARAGSTPAVLVGLPAALSEDRLKAIGAAAASSGEVAIFHAVGSTPEAATLTDALQNEDAEVVAEIPFIDLLTARRELMTARDTQPLRAVSLGTPHASLAELRRYAGMLGDDRVSPRLELVINTGRQTLETLEGQGLAARLRAAGAALVVDTCSYISPVLHDRPGSVMTDSGKWAYYAPATIGAEVVFGSTAECLVSAVAGRVVRLPSAWQMT
jgi:predicted aconitase